MKYQTRPIVIEAEQFTEEVALDCLMNHKPFFGVLSVSGNHNPMHIPPTLYSAWVTIPTPNGRVSVNFGDWVIRDARGEFSQCGDELFRATYDKP